MAIDPELVEVLCRVIYPDWDGMLDLERQDLIRRKIHRYLEQETAIPVERAARAPRGE